MGVSAMDAEEITKIYTKAQELYCLGSDDDIELDDLSHYLNDAPVPSRFSEATEGTWVQAWVWVPNSLLEEG